jgi:hypothetical protein
MDIFRTPKIVFALLFTIVLILAGDSSCEDTSIIRDIYQANKVCWPSSEAVLYTLFWVQDQDLIKIIEDFEGAGDTICWYDEGDIANGRSRPLLTLPPSRLYYLAVWVAGDWWIYPDPIESVIPCVKLTYQASAGYLHSMYWESFLDSGTGWSLCMAPVLGQNNELFWYDEGESEQGRLNPADSRIAKRFYQIAKWPFPVELENYLLDSSGDSTESDNFILKTTSVGQPVSTGRTSSSNYQTSSGFLYTLRQ